VLKHRSMDLLTTITPFDEDSQYWYVVETRGKNVIDILRYRKFDFLLSRRKIIIFWLFLAIRFQKLHIAITHNTSINSG
jgi:hypothetical protein